MLIDVECTELMKQRSTLSHPILIGYALCAPLKRYLHFADGLASHFAPQSFIRLSFIDREWETIKNV